LISQNILGNLVIHPAGRGTAAAILFGLLRLSHSRRIGTVAIFPSDHYVLKLYRLMHVAMLPAAISPPGEPVAGRNV
jgi:mannose-1-phosphate guanylyltransferase